MIVFDLDDTLYKECEFVDSGMAFLKRLYPDRNINGLWDAEMLDAFRYHTPTISLSAETAEMLEKLRLSRHKLGLITDGRSLTQRNKIKALRLEKWIDNNAILISGETGADKNTDFPFREMSRKFPDEKIMVYVGDNPQKDFLHPNRLGWETVMLSDNGQNIHPQSDAADLPKDFEARHIIQNISELPELLLKIC